MICPQLETLAFLEPFVPYELVRAEAFAFIRRLAGHLPDATASYYLECRLSGNADRVDFLTCTTAGQGRSILGGPIATPWPGALQGPLWERIHAFHVHWAAPASPLHTAVPMVWWEFDDVGPSEAEQPRASLSYCLEPAYLRPDWDAAAPERFDAERFQRLMEQPLECLSGQALPSRIRENLWACFIRLPERGRFIHVSAMLARSPSPVKLYGFIPSEHLPGYLASIGWPGDEARLQHLLSAYCEPVLSGDAFIDLTVGETVSPRLGMAFPRLHVKRHTDGEQRWHHLLEQCVHEGLCTPRKREALMSWEGSCRHTYTGEAWPMRLNRWADVKLVHEPGAPLEAKVYLGATPVFSLF